MDRADARRGARINRINVTQSPYGNRERRRKKEKPQKGGLWSFIKSWSFFGHDEDANMDGDSDSDDDMVGVQQTSYFAKMSTEGHFFMRPNRVEEEAKATLVAPAPTFIPDDDDLGAYRMPGGLGNSPPYRPTPPPPIAPRLLELTRIPVNAKKMPPPRQRTPQVAYDGGLQAAPQNEESKISEDFLGMMQRQVAKFLLHKADTPLTSEEYQQCLKMLRLAVDKDAHQDGATGLEADPILKRALEEAEAAENAEPPEQPYMGTVITSVPPGEKFDEIIPQTFGLKPASETKEKSDEKSDGKSDEKGDESASTSGTERYSPAPSFGLPQFEPPEDPHRPPSPEPEIPPEEVEADDKLRMTLEDRAEKLRKYLHLDEYDVQDDAAWDELERWKGLKSPTSSATGSDATTSVGSSSGTSRGDEDEDENTKLPDDLFDYNKGYTPAELMINPYERLCAFRNRKVHRKIVSVEDLAAIRKKRAAAREEATRLKVEAERREAEEAKKAEDAANATDIREERRQEVPVPPIPAKTEITMGLLDAGVSKRAFKCALPYEAEPTHERPTSGDWITSGTTKSGVRYEKAVKRKATTLYLEVNGVLLDPPLEGRPTKRRRSNSPEPAIEDDPNLKNAIIMSVGVEQVAEQEEEEEEDDEEMVDETPEPPPPAPVVLARPSPARRKPRPRIRPVPDASRPKHFQYSPVTPSPLRMVSAFDSPKDSPKQASVEIPPEAVPPKKEAPVKGEESYHFATQLYRLGSIGPVRTSKEMFKANQRAFEYSPYLLPEYKMGSGKYRTRYNRGFKRRIPKALRKKKNAGNKPVNPDAEGFEVGFSDPAPAKAREVQLKSAKPSAKPSVKPSAKPSTTPSIKPPTANPDPVVPTTTLESQSREEASRLTTKLADTTKLTNGTETSDGTKPTNNTKLTNGTKPTNGIKLTNGTKLADSIALIKETKLINGTKLTNGTKITNGIKLTNGTKPIEGTKLTDSTIPIVKIMNGIHKSTEETIPSLPAFLEPKRRVRHLPAMIRELRPLSNSSRRKPVTSTSSSDPLIHSLSKATNPMPDDIPPLRLPELSTPRPTRPTRVPRLREGPSAAMRCYDWAAAGIRPIETTIRSPGFDLLSLPPITNSLGIWSCNNCMIGNSPDAERCHCCGRYADGRTPTSRYAGYVPGYAPRAIAV